MPRGFRLSSIWAPPRPPADRPRVVVTKNLPSPPFHGAVMAMTPSARIIHMDWVRGAGLVVYVEQLDHTSGEEAAGVQVWAIGSYTTVPEGAVHRWTLTRPLHNQTLDEIWHVYTERLETD